MINSNEVCRSGGPAVGCLSVVLSVWVVTRVQWIREISGDAAC